METSFLGLLTVYFFFLTDTGLDKGQPRLVSQLQVHAWEAHKKHGSTKWSILCCGFPEFKHLYFRNFLSQMLWVHCEAFFINLSFQTCTNPFTYLTAQTSGAVKCMIYSHAASQNTVIYFQPAAKELSLFFSPDFTFCERDWISVPCFSLHSVWEST